MDIVPNINIFSDESHSDDEIDDLVNAIGLNRRVHVIRQRLDHMNYWNDVEFINRFRLSKNAVQNLLTLIENRIRYPTNRNFALTPIQQLLLCLRFYAAGNMLISVGDFVGVHKSTASMVIKKVTTAICQIKNEFLKMPDDEKLIIQQGFYKIASFPRVLLAIDGTHIKIQSPGGDEAERFRNRKGYFSLNVMLACDHQLKIRNIVARWPGASNDINDGVSLEGGMVEVSADGNTTTSKLSFTPTASDHGLTLTCKASNQRIPLSELRETWMLKVFYPPKVTLTMGHALDANEIKEGDDVYFECHLVANPWVLRVWWLRDGERLQSNTTNGIIVSNQTLVLQRVSRSSAGRYCCEASNSEGSSRSPPFHLRVKFEPVCADGTGKKLLGAAKDEPLRVECKVDAEPAASLFRWSFNSTPGVSKELSEFVSEPGSSMLTYIPKALADYGTLQCWARNDLGSQRTPCIYQIVRAGPPEPPNPCQALNTTHHSAVISCRKGFDGGLKQKFGMVLNYGDVLLTNLSGPVPEFPITNLEPSQEYTATIYSINVKGLSKTSTVLQFRTQPAPGLNEQRRSTGPRTEEKSMGPWLYILLAAGSTLIVAAAVGAIIFAVRKFRVDSPVRERRQRSPKREEIPLNPQVSSYTDNTTITDDKNPDLIPPSNETLLENAAPYTISARPSSKRNSATQMPVKPYHVTWAPILQSRNCATQTPPPHKESSV